ncbi:MAG TPA: hypothetical protein VHF22_00550, partial [Planctomycetota bacterium]|nr:hypothetical protein [Planctomycetota bacterium]
TGIEHDAFGFTGREEADVKTGRGFGGRIAVGKRRGGALVASLGALYLQTEHRERTGRAFVREHLAFLEARGSAAFDWPLSPYFGASLGLGGGSIHFDKVFRDGGGAAGELGALLGLRIVEHVDIGGAAYFYILGYPTNTVGTGVILALEVTVRF